MTERSSVLKRAMVSQGGEQDTRTPLSLFRELDEEFSFELDPCTSSSKENNLDTPHYFTKEQDGLSQDWSGYKSVFINPPFKEISKWIAKLLLELEKNSDLTVVLLAPSKTETKWWHTLLTSKYLKEIRFQKGRVAFEGHKGSFIFGISFFILTSEVTNPD